MSASMRKIRFAMRLKPGDHVRVTCKTCAGVVAFKHHGIVATVPDSDDRDTLLTQITIIHFSSPPAGGSNRIIETSLEYFLQDGEDSEIVDPAEDPLFDGDDVVSRARSQLGKTKYNLSCKNCEHFASWCTHGSAFSRQVHQYGIGFAVATVVCGIITTVLMTASRNKWA